MNSQPQSVAQANNACAAWANAALFSTKLMGLMACWIAFAGLQLHAQTYTQYDLTDFVHAVNGPNALLSEGDTATFQVVLGGEDAPARHVMGMQLDLSLSNLAQIPNAVAISVNGSWCFDPGNLHTCSTAGDATLSLLVQTANGSSKSGAGFVFSFELIAKQDDVEPSDMIAAIDGIVIVENIDCKMAQYPQNEGQAFSDIGDQSPIIAAEASMQFKPCFPNPTQGRLQLPLPLDAEMQLQLIAADGQIHSLHAQYQMAASLLDISSLPAGVYQLLIWRSGRAIYRDRILKI